MIGLKNNLLLVLFSGCLALVGCSSLDRVGSKMDSVMGHEQASGPLAYEGQLETARRVGDMTALQFKDGQYFDVSRAFGALYPGDTVRVYQSSDGYEAHLWRSAQNASKPSDSSHGS